MEEETFTFLSYKISAEVMLDKPDNSQEEIVLTLSHQEKLEEPFDGRLKLPFKVSIKVPEKLLQPIMTNIESTLVRAIFKQLIHIKACIAKFTFTTNLSAFSSTGEDRQWLKEFSPDLAWFVETFDYWRYFIEFAEKYDHYYKIAKQAQTFYKAQERGLLKRHHGYEKSSVWARRQTVASQQFPSEITDLLGQRSTSDIAFICTARYFSEDAVASNGQIARNFKEDLAKGKKLLPYKAELESAAKHFFEQAATIMLSKVTELLLNDNKREQQTDALPKNILKPVRRVFPTSKHLSEDMQPIAQEVNELILSIINAKPNTIKEK